MSDESPKSDQSSNEAGAVDVYEITRLVTPVMATSPLVPSMGPLACYTNGKSFFFTDEQVGAIAEVLSRGQVRRRLGGGWEEVIPGKGLRVLAERHINGAVYYRLRKHWDFEAASPE